MLKIEFIKDDSVTVWRVKYLGQSVLLDNEETVFDLIKELDVFDQMEITKLTMSKEVYEKVPEFTGY